MSGGGFDVLVVGRGIVGLAHAWAAARLGLRAAVLDRETHAVGASVRNFGFVTVTGQQAGITWRRARRARDLWAEAGCDPAAMDLVRLAMPRRVYTQSHADYVVETFAEIAAVKDSLAGFRIAWEPAAMRHFTARFAPLAA